MPRSDSLAARGMAAAVLVITLLLAQAQTIDAAGPSATHGPTVSGVGVTSVSKNAATITWSLNVPATGQVKYGRTKAYGRLSTPELSYKYRTHVQTLSGLSPGTRYHFRVMSKNAAGGKTVSRDHTFTTLGARHKHTPKPGRKRHHHGIPVPGSIDASGGSDVGGALQRFVDGVPDGSTIVFKSGGTYRVSHGLRLFGRHDLVFAGNGATIQTTGPGDDIVSSAVPGRAGLAAHHHPRPQPGRQQPRRGHRERLSPRPREPDGRGHLRGLRRRDRQRQHEALLRRLRVHRGQRQHQAWSERIWMHDSSCTLNGRRRGHPRGPRRDHRARPLRPARRLAGRHRARHRTARVPPTSPSAPTPSAPTGSPTTAPAGSSPPRAPRAARSAMSRSSATPSPATPTPATTAGPGAQRHRPRPRTAHRLRRPRQHLEHHRGRTVDDSSPVSTA